jgi:superfamily II DNA helicase RecQ
MSLSKLQPLDDFHYDSVTMVDPTVDALVLKVFNLSGITLREWQKGAVYCLMKKYDLLVKAGTGTGKSWVFWSMALSRPRGIVLVLAPLKAIMKNHVSVFDSRHPTDS